MSRILVVVMVISALAFSASAAHAHSSGELLSFQGVQDMQPVGDFYNGAGLPGTPNYGITFSSNFLGLRSFSRPGNGAFAPTPTATPAIFLPGSTGNSVTGIMNVSGGFTNGLQFFYTAGFSQTVTLWSGTNGTGTVLATISLAANDGNCMNFPTYCNWSTVGVNLGSSSVKSVTFTGPANSLGISDITVGASTTAVPEPSTLCLLGTGLVGASIRQLRKIRKR